MALIIVGNPPWTLAQRGVELNETGVAIRRFQVRYFAEINERLQDNVGQVIARAVSDKFSREITVEAEITGITGVMLFTLGVAITFTNDVNTFVPISGIILLDEATVTQERAGWKSLNMRASNNPYL